MSRILVAFGLLFVTACNRDITINKTFNIDASSAPANGACSLNTRTIDLTDISIFDSLKDRVTNVEVKHAHITVVDPKTASDSVATSVSGAVWISDVGASERTSLGAFDALALTAGEHKDITLNADGVTRLKTLATNDPWAFDVTAEGCADAYPAHFSLQGEIEANVSFSLF